MYAIQGGLQGNVLLALYKLRSYIKKKEGLLQLHKISTYRRNIFTILLCIVSRDELSWSVFQMSYKHKTKIENDSSIHTIPFVQCFFRSIHA